MNTITIDPGFYHFAVHYAASKRVTVESIVESYFLQLRDKEQRECGAAIDRHEPKVLPYEQLRPELRAILSLSEPLKGTVPEWDLNGDTARNDALK